MGKKPWYERFEPVSPGDNENRVVPNLRRMLRGLGFLEKKLPNSARYDQALDQAISGFYQSQQKVWHHGTLTPDLYRDIADAHRLHLERRRAAEKSRSMLALHITHIPGLHLHR